ncbi:MAG: gsiA 9 [Geminicoccaceae bacterium]|jgi:peptide/nickel transport system ATP-binding protein|nr:gsiA 9 [Geminicoccaceae bacterium]
MNLSGASELDRLEGSADPVLEIRDLSVEFVTSRGRVRALRHTGLQVPQGRIVGIVGESGSGKSTLILGALALLPGNAEVTSGEVLFAGSDVLKLSPAALRDLRGNRIAVVFQDPMTSLNPVQSIAAQMIDLQYRERRIGRREKRRRAIRMLQRVGIPDPESRIDDYPHQFSGGMRQRIAIAMALLAGPDLLIADEPTTALDVTLEAQIIHLLRELRESFAGSILFASHNLGLIAELCDQVAVMYAGEVVEEGSVFDLFHRPRHPYTQALLDCEPASESEMGRELATIPGEVPDLIRVPPGCVFAPRCPHAFERCRRVAPGWTAAANGQRARCHLLAEG